jgi:hypothetical protein
METLKNGNIETWKHGNMETWKHGNMETWKHGNLETWKHGNILFLNCGLLETETIPQKRAQPMHFQPLTNRIDLTEGDPCADRGRRPDTVFQTQGLFQAEDVAT